MRAPFRISTQEPAAVRRPGLAALHAPGAGAREAVAQPPCACRIVAGPRPRFDPSDPGVGDPMAA
jgi:hypothetical protein